MNKRLLAYPVLLLCSFLVVVLGTSIARSQEQGGAGPEKLEKLSQVLNLSPQQKSQLAPILEAEGPKVQAIKENPSLSGREKMKELKSVHDQTDPLVKTILNPTQYKQWEEIRKDEINQMKKGGG